MNGSVKLQKISLLALLLLTHLTATAQEETLTDYYPVGTTWETVYMHITIADDPEHFTRTQHTIVKDTILRNKSYRHVKSVVTECPKTPETIGYITNYYIRQEGDSIFFIPPYGLPERLAYNFNWQENDSIMVTPHKTYPIGILTRQEAVMQDGKTYDCYFLKVYQNYEKNYGEKLIIRTIGQTFGGLFVGFPDIIRNGNWNRRLTKFTRNGVTIYEDDIPTPQVDAISQILDDDQGIRQGCYTLQGMKVRQDTLRPGIYIVDGRKTLVR